MKCIEDVREFMTAAGQAVPTLEQGQKLLDGTTPIMTARLAILGHTLQEHAKGIKTVRDEGKVVGLRARLMCEELGETLEAMSNDDMEGVADGLADLVYVVAGTALALGIPLDKVWDEVQRSNMSKFPECDICGGSGQLQDLDNTVSLDCPECSGAGLVALRDDHGKIIKPDGWTPPDIASVLQNA